MISNEEGPHGHSQNHTLAMAVAAGKEEVDRWLDFQVKAGTVVYNTITFLQDIISLRQFVCVLQTPQCTPSATLLTILGRAPSNAFSIFF
jgi:hypothetical protein